MHTQPTNTEPDGSGLIQLDPWLEPYRAALVGRYEHYRWMKGSLPGELTGEASLGHHYFGFNRGTHDGKPGVWYREWAPAAKALFLCGDFNGWNRGSHPLARDEWGVWAIFLPDEGYAATLVHGGKLKVYVVSESG